MSAPPDDELVCPHEMLLVEARQLLQEALARVALAEAERDDAFRKAERLETSANAWAATVLRLQADLEDARRELARLREDTDTGGGR